VEPDPELAGQAQEALAGHNNARAVQALGQEVRDMIGFCRSRDSARGDAARRQAV